MIRLDELEQKLNPKHFFRLNRKYFSQLSAIERIEPHFNGRLKIKLRHRDDDDIYVSREKAEAFKKWLDAENCQIHQTRLFDPPTNFHLRIRGFPDKINHIGSAGSFVRKFNYPHYVGMMGVRVEIGG